MHASRAIAVWATICYASLRAAEARFARDGRDAINSVNFTFVNSQNSPRGSILLRVASRRGFSHRSRKGRDGVSFSRRFAPRNCKFREKSAAALSGVASRRQSEIGQDQPTSRNFASLRDAISNRFWFWRGIVVSRREATRN